MHHQGRARSADPSVRRGPEQGRREEARGVVLHRAEGRGEQRLASQAGGPPDERVPREVSTSQRRAGGRALEAHAHPRRRGRPALGSGDQRRAGRRVRAEARQGARGARGQPQVRALRPRGARDQGEGPQDHQVRHRHREELERAGAGHGPGRGRLCHLRALGGRAAGRQAPRHPHRLRRARRRQQGLRRGGPARRRPAGGAEGDPQGLQG
mmetsp:Transcript_4164/g.12115  ORF Transcript_4164/g.12115 Transcript_4164/m.12115 type:complete len:211 (-) Transcript_4164:1925-2557(-)